MASAVIGALRVNLGIDSAEFQDGLRNAAKSLKGLGKSMQSLGRNMSTYISAPITGLAALTIKTAGDFEASMNRVEAATGATTDQIKAMRDMAVDLGAKTSFSASEAADAMEMLAKNGLDASQIMGGAVAASMDLAAASGTDLSSAADVATDVMMNFGKEAKELAPLVDGITGVLLESKFGFDDYRLAIGQAGGVAGNLGVSFEDFNAVIAATSASFASGSDAGTSYKNFLTRLVPASDTAAAAMKELGLQFFNADGSMRTMSEIAGELQTKMGGLSDEALNQNMKDIFGVDAMRTAIMLMQQGSTGLDAFKARIGDASAEEQAAARLKGFNGELEKLKGAFETLQIAIADSGLLQVVTDFVTQLAGWVDALAETNPELLKWGTIIAGLAAALGPVVLAVGVLATGIAAISAPVALVVAGIAALTAGIIAFWPQIDAAGKAVNQFLFSIGPNLLAALNTAKAKFLELGTYLEGLSDQIVGFFAALPGQMMQIGSDIMQGLWDGLKSKMSAVKDSIAGFASGMVDSVKSTLGIHSPSKVMHEVGTNIMDGLGQGMQSMQGGIENIASNIGSTIANAFSGVIDGSKSVKEAISDVLKSLASMLMNNAFQSLFGASTGGGFFGSLFKGLFGGILGFSRGGTILPGGAGGIDSQLVMFRKSPNERVDITKPGQTLSHGGVMDVQVGVSVDDDGKIQAFVRNAERRATHAGASLGAKQVRKNMPALMADAQLRDF